VRSDLCCSAIDRADWLWFTVRRWLRCLVLIPSRVWFVPRVQELLQMYDMSINFIMKEEKTMDKESADRERSTTVYHTCSKIVACGQNMK
jgi:hypothetical protein